MPDDPEVQEQLRLARHCDCTASDTLVKLKYGSMIKLTKFQKLSNWKIQLLRSTIVEEVEGGFVLERVKLR